MIAKGIAARKRPKFETVVIEMSEDEARTLYEICHHISGNPYRSRRRHADELARVLEVIGVEGVPLEVGEAGNLDEIHFWDREE